jgi:dihydrofolate reductase
MTSGAEPLVIAGMTMSLDGFVEDERGSVGRLYSDLAALRGTPYMDGLIAETGAVLMGRRAFEMSPDPDWYVGNYEFQVPIFVLTHHPPARPPKQDEHLTFTFVDDLSSAVEQARVAADGKAVTVVGGIRTIQQLLAARLVDELRLDVMPVLLGSGRRLLDGIEADGFGLQTVAVGQVGERTTLRFRIAR